MAPSCFATFMSSRHESERELCRRSSRLSPRIENRHLAPPSVNASSMELHTLNDRSCGKRESAVRLLSEMLQLSRLTFDKPRQRDNAATPTSVTLVPDASRLSRVAFVVARSASPVSDNFTQFRT